MNGLTVFNSANAQGVVSSAHTFANAMRKLLGMTKKPTSRDIAGDRLIASVDREMQLPRLAESVRSVRKDRTEKATAVEGKASRRKR